MDNALNLLRQEWITTGCLLAAAFIFNFFANWMGKKSRPYKEYLKKYECNHETMSEMKTTNKRAALIFLAILLPLLMLIQLTIPAEIAVEGDGMIIIVILMLLMIAISLWFGWFFMAIIGTTVVVFRYLMVRSAKFRGTIKIVSDYE